MSVNSMLSTLLLAMAGGGAPATPGAQQPPPAPADIAISKVEDVDESKPGDVSLQAGSKKKISVKADGISDLKWKNLDEKNVQMTVSDDKKSAVVTSRNAGEYTILVYGAKLDANKSPVATDAVIIKIKVTGSRTNGSPKAEDKPPTNPVAKALQDAHAQDKSANQNASLRSLGMAIDAVRSALNDTARVTNWNQALAPYDAATSRYGIANLSPQLQSRIQTLVADRFPGSRSGAALTADDRQGAADLLQQVSNELNRMWVRNTR